MLQLELFKKTKKWGRAKKVAVWWLVDNSYSHHVDNFAKQVWGVYQKLSVTVSFW